MISNLAVGLVQTRDFAKYKSINVKIEGLEKNTPLSQVLDSQELANKKIKQISSCRNSNIGIKNPELPFDFNNSAGAQFIAAIQGDGHIDKTLRCGYSNQDKKLVQRVLNAAKAIFGEVDYKIYFRPCKTFNLNFPKIIGLSLIELGLKPGFKPETNNKIPEFIIRGEKETKAAYLKQFFSDEGNVRLKDRRVQAKQTIKLKISDSKLIRKDPENFCPKVLLGCKKLLHDFGIDSKISLGYLRKEEKNHGDFELSIYRIENLKRFQEEIGFLQERKNKLLSKAIKSYKFPSAERNGKIKFALKCCKQIQKKHDFITKELLMLEAKRSKKTATYYLVELKKKGLVKVIEKSRDSFGHFKGSFKYQLSQSCLKQTKKSF